MLHQKVSNVWVSRAHRNLRKLTDIASMLTFPENRREIKTQILVFITAGCYPTKTHWGTVFEETDVVSLTFWMRKATQISVSGTLMMSSLLLSPPSTNQPNVWLELPAREPPTPALTGRAHFVRLGFLIGWYCHVPLCCLDKNRLPKNYKNSSGHWQHEKPNMLYS